MVPLAEPKCHVANVLFDRVFVRMNIGSPLTESPLHVKL